MTLWLWSRYAESMDFRAYDTVSHKHSYGGVMNVPEGIANTNELTLKLFDRMPGKEAILDFAADLQTPNTRKPPMKRPCWNTSGSTSGRWSSASGTASGITAT